MNTYISAQEAVIDMQDRGFSNDFQLFGNDLLWVQEKIFVRMGEFIIVEYHQFYNPPASQNETIVFGIIALHHNVKGILLNDYNRYTLRTPPVIIKKLNELQERITYRQHL